MPVREEAHEDELEHMPLPDNCSLDLIEDRTSRAQRSLEDGIAHEASRSSISALHPSIVVGSSRSASNKAPAAP